VIAKPFLFDVNVLLALAWPNHIHHTEAGAWFAKNHSHGFRTCPLTQTAFVRISSNPAFTSEAVAPSQAMGLLARICRMPGHDFWPDDLPLHDGAADAKTVTGHRQVIDLYLLRLAAAHGGLLATLDRGAALLAKSEALPVALIH
jgi:toxin-antitoxin system PIN domain toxin